MRRVLDGQAGTMAVEEARQLLALAGDGSADQERLQLSVQAFMAATRNAGAPEVGEALASLGEAFALPHTPGQMAALMAAGAAIERGADATPLIAPAVAFLRQTAPLALAFRRACAALVPDDADDASEAFRAVSEEELTRSPEAGQAWQALECLYPPLIAVLAAAPEARSQARALATDLAELGEENDGASWLRPMVMVLHKEPLLVIEPETRLGLVGTMLDVASNFELHVLLMDIFPPSQGALQTLARRIGLKRRRVSQRAVDIVRGIVADQREEPVIGQWNLHAWTALQATGRLPHGIEPEATAHWIWNEGIPADIPVFDGYRVVVLGPPSYERNFDAQRQFSGLRPDIEVERLLSPGEVNTWVERFSQPRPL